MYLVQANGNLYGVYPFWMVIEDGINTHGVLVLNAAAQGNYYEEILAIKCHCAVSVDSKNRILMRQK